MTDVAKSKRRRPIWFLWWQVDSWELKRQVADYDKLKLNQSARGISMMLLVGSALLTAAVVLLTRGTLYGLVDVVIGVVLGLFMMGRNGWSKIAAMIYWSLEKLVALLAAVFGPTHGLLSFGQLIWWAVFMHFFYLAYRVERERRRPAVTVEEVFS